MAAEVPTVILYEYPESPYARKVRWFLQLLSIPYISWPQPFIVPRPALVAQGINYRRIPILQINSETYCDSHLIFTALTEAFPQSVAAILHAPPSPSANALAHLLEDYVDRILFMPVAESIPQTNGSVLSNAAFRKDRRGFGRQLGREDMPYLRQNGLNTLRRFLETLESEVLVDGRKWITGGEGISGTDVAVGVMLEWVWAWKEWTEGIKGVERETYPKTGKWLEGVVATIRKGEKKILKVIKSDEEGLASVKELGQKFSGKETKLGQLETLVPIPLSLEQVVDVVPADSGRTHPQRGTIKSVLKDRFAVQTNVGSILWFPWRGFEVRKVPDGDEAKL